jgi:hypothetical protein
MVPKIYVALRWMNDCCDLHLIARVNHEAIPAKIDDVAMVTTNGP